MLDGVLQRRDQCLILRKVVGLVSEVLTERSYLLPLRIVDHHAVSRRAWIAASPAVGVCDEMNWWCRLHEEFRMQISDCRLNELILNLQSEILLPSCRQSRCEARRQICRENSLLRRSQVIRRAAKRHCPLFSIEYGE